MYKHSFSILLTLIFFAGWPSMAQNTPAQLAVPVEDEDQAADVLKSISQTTQDTNRVKLLLKASHIYWHHRKEDRRRQDSSLQSARTAYQLSTKLRYTYGSNEALFMMCKVYAEKNETEQAKALLPLTHGELSVQLMLIIAEHFVFKSDPITAEYPKAYPLISSARSISDSIRSERWLDECLNLLGKYHFGRGDIANGKKAIQEITTRYENTRNYGKAAQFWSNLATYMPENDSTYLDIIYGHERAVHYYGLANDPKNLAYSLRDLGVANSNHNRKDSGEKQLLRVVEILTAIGERISPTTYNIIGDYYRFTGENNKALAYALKAHQLPYASEVHRYNSQYLLGSIYEQTADYENSLKYYQAALDYQLSFNGSLIHLVAYQMANTMVAAGKADKALTFLDDLVKDHPPRLQNDKQKLAATYGNIHAALRNYPVAEKYFLNMLSLNQSVHEENGRSFNYSQNTLTGSGAFFMIGKFYTERGRYKEGKNYLERSLQNAQYFDITQELETYQMLYKADSALGNYLAAMNSQNKYRAKYDSVNAVQRARQLNELNIQYETEQKQKDIEVLKGNEQLQNARLERAGIIRNIIIGGAVMLLLLAVLAYNGYRNKQRSNLQLQQKQEEINEQNVTLQTLVEQKDEYLQEKEWLLKEVHHRVKNNLQIVMSLLSTQSAYLATEDAKQAILESKNRVKSIALIHQKLYKSDEEANINIQDYVGDLLDHLEDGFDIKDRSIHIIKEVANINIDLSFAVPIGLILNEAITNAIKYAFGSHGGTIIVRFLQSGDVTELAVIDNGKGLPDDFKPSRARSLGMEMMHGLTKQLRGAIDISGENGTSVIVRFQQ